jgi:murein DD-endopeptidase MepM/ murein hydrolase activator NlpD
MRKLTILILLLMFFVVGANFAWAQTDEERVAQLRQQIDLLEKEAEKYRDNIAGQKEKAASLQRDISILQNEMKGLEAQIALTSKKIDTTKIEITGVQGNIFSTQEKINHQKNTIARLVLFYNNLDNENLLETILKNDNISEFFRQEQYANSVNQDLLNAVNDLKDAKSSLENNKDQLETKQQELERLNKEQAAKKNSLSSVKSNKNTLLKQTKGQEAEYQKMLTDIERKEAEFFTELQKLENDVVANGLYIVTVTADKLPKKGTKLFAWPEEGKRITQGYGMTAYAKKGAYGGAGHNGIDIASGFGSSIYAIGDGEIIANGKNDGWGNWVAIKHPGAYNLVSIYGHMSALSLLKVGSHVKAGDVIGYEGATGNVTGSHLHLSLYKHFFTYEKKGQLYFNYFEGSINPLDYL